MWISPNDVISTAIVSTATAINTGSPTPDNDSTAENAVQQVPWNTNYTQQIAIERAKDSLTSFRNIRSPASHFKYMLRISPIIFPAQVAACPPRTETDTILSSEQFLINICDFSGYSFSDELEEIFNPESKKKQLADSNATNIYQAIKRAISAVHKSFRDTDDEFLKAAANFVLQTIGWECLVLADAVVAKTLTSFLEKYENNAKVSIQTKVAKLVTVYIGKFKDTENLRVTLRCVLSASLRSTVKESSRPVPEAESYYIYYRHYEVTKEQISSAHRFESSSNGTLRKDQRPDPLPPPLFAKAEGTSDDKDDFIQIYIVDFLKKEIIDQVPAEEMNEGANIPDETETISESSCKPWAQPEDGDNDADNSETDEQSSSGLDKNHFSDLVVWGLDTCGSSGLNLQPKEVLAKTKEQENFTKGSELDGGFISQPRPLPIQRAISLQRVRMIACSARHSILLTNLGSVYSCGENSEGALGHGDLQLRERFELVESFMESTVRISRVAAGATTIGSHSMAVSTDGSLFGWGVGQLSGLNSTSPVLIPTKITIPPENDENNEDEFLIVDVSCGGGFSVCITKSGRLYSWGVWSHGRLGLGPIPSIQQAGGGFRRSASPKKLARYQLRPSAIPGIGGTELSEGLRAMRISCGEGHGLCVLNCGAVLAWGRNNCGQLGIGTSVNGFLCDAFSPIILPPFLPTHDGKFDAHLSASFAPANPSMRYSQIMDTLLVTGSATAAASMYNSGRVFGKDVVCGAFHSLCLDSEGIVWSWGARGSPCLGHHDGVLVPEEWNSRINSLFPLNSTSNKHMVPYDLRPWCEGVQESLEEIDDDSLAVSLLAKLYSAGGWAVPRKIHSLEVANVRVEQLSAGDLHSAFLSQGHLFICGCGPVVPPFLSMSQLMLASEENIDSSAHSYSQNGVVSGPRCPSAGWLPELSNRKIGLVASGGSRMFALVCEELVDDSLTGPLLRKLTSSSKIEGIPSDVSLSAASMSLNSFEQDQEMLEEMEARGRADCVVIIGGRSFFCHRALLAHRSQELRSRIAAEYALSGVGDGSTGNRIPPPTQLLLPELQKDAAKALIYYLYRDRLPRWATGDAVLLGSLARAGKTLRIPRLLLLCESFMRLLSRLFVGDQTELELPWEMPPPTLARDLGSLLGDSEFADVRFIAEGRAIAAHRFVLEARCEYFRAMFHSGMMEDGLGAESDSASASIPSSRSKRGNSGKVLDVVVPDSFVGFLRLLIFIYTNTLPDGSDGALLEDLMAADRYGLKDMAQLCESMLAPSAQNWLDLLRTADLLGNGSMMLRVLAFLRDRGTVMEKSSSVPVEVKAEKGHLQESQRNEYGADVDNNEEEEALQNEFPGLCDHLQRNRTIQNPSPPPNWLVQEADRRKKEEQERLEQQSSRAFPLWALVMAFACIVVYRYVNTIIVLGPYIYVVNGIAGAGGILLAYRSLKN